MEIKKEPQIPNDEVFTEIFFFLRYVCVSYWLLAFYAY